jgi:hypothetical protein
MKIKYPHFQKYKNYYSTIFIFYLILVIHGNQERSVMENEQILSRINSDISKESTQEAFQKIARRQTNWLSLQRRLR